VSPAKISKNDGRKPNVFVPLLTGVCRNSPSAFQEVRRRGAWPGSLFQPRSFASQASCGAPVRRNHIVAEGHILNQVVFGRPHVE